MTTKEPQQTSTSNIEYNLVSVIYHKLEAAVSTFVYVVDAQWVGDMELTQFFLNNYQEERRTADRAEQLLSARLNQQQAQQSQQSQQAQFAQGQGQFGQGQFGQGQFGQGQFGQGQFGQGQFGQGQYPDPRMYSGAGHGMYGGGMGGYGSNPGMYGTSMMGGYGSNPGMYGGYSSSPGMYGGYGQGMFSRSSGLGMYGGGMGGGMYGGQFGGNQFGGEQSVIPDLRQITGTSDVTYDLISTIYHALKEAQTLKAYVQDGQRSTDQEIAQFFQQITEQANRCADQARRLLAQRLSYKQMRQGYYGGQYGSQAGQPIGVGTDTGATTGRTAAGSPDTGTRR